MNFEITHIFLMKWFSLHDQMSWEQKERLSWNKNYFSSFLKGLLLKQIKQGRWESNFKQVIAAWVSFWIYLVYQFSPVISKFEYVIVCMLYC